MAGKGDEVASLRKEVDALKEIIDGLKTSVELLETEKDHLRQAVRKLKMETTRTKEKLKKLQEHVKAGPGEAASDDEEFPDYDELGRDFILIGGSHDPLAVRYEAAILDEDGVEHKSAERYYWYKMAEFFGDTASRDAIHSASTTPKAEDAMKEIKNFDENKWNEVKVEVWETGQRLKLEQVRWIANLLVETGPTYIAVAHQDKILGSGWRKNRDESNKPIFWDGQNLGGKFLMRYRKTLQETHVWAGPCEKDEATRKVAELKKYVWRRIDTHNYRGGFRGGRGNGGGFRGGNRTMRQRGSRKDGHSFNGHSSSERRE